MFEVAAFLGCPWAEPLPEAACRLTGVFQAETRRPGTYSVDPQDVAPGGEPTDKVLATGRVPVPIVGEYDQPDAW